MWYRAIGTARLSSVRRDGSVRNVRASRERLGELPPSAIPVLLAEFERTYGRVGDLRD